MHEQVGNMDMYAGGLIIEFKPWQFQAMGVYATVAKDELTAQNEVSLSPFGKAGSLARTFADEKNTTLTMAFIYVMLNGPWFSRSLVDLSGLVEGFGVNSDILLLIVEQVVGFPVIKDRPRDGGGDEKPIHTMKRLMKGIWFRLIEGLFWAAVGVRVTAFQMLAMDAVIVVQFGTDLKLGWLIQAGTFSVLVTFRFAVNTGILKERRGSGVKEQDLPIPAEQTKIYARPMQMTTSLAFEATVHVKSKKPTDETTSAFLWYGSCERVLRAARNWRKGEQEWRVTAVIKPVQKSTWGKREYL
ncbi:hypothetical protein CTA1_5306 [Colletotrichum tanaceti]|uniref:DUF6603 domain-containing protein n=1 Tax=Colletotrichum tanaceti TaxID=1306861 RepID=A0A4U6X6T6_9PEZI|nr:hypothetical protein CTA1_5306 [Colletotrichum tanaceti]